MTAVLAPARLAHLAVPKAGLWYPACSPVPGLHWPLRFYPDEVTCPDCQALTASQDASPAFQSQSPRAGER